MLYLQRVRAIAFCRVSVKTGFTAGGGAGRLCVDSSSGSIITKRRMEQSVNVIRSAHTLIRSSEEQQNQQQQSDCRSTAKPATAMNLKNLLSTGVRASFYRGGTSKGLMIHGPDLGEMWTSLSFSQKQGNLKECEQALRPFFMAAMGSPDEYGRQLNGMGGGLSSLSKAVIVERADRALLSSSSADDDDDDDDDADANERHGVHINYWFVQIGIRDGQLDMAGNCGNLSAAVAPFALDLGLLSIDELNTTITTTRSSSELATNIPSNDLLQADVSTAHIILRNMNTGKKLRAEVQIVKVDDSICFQPSGDYKLDGVSGTASPVSLSFLTPGGAKTGKSLPTGNAVDTLVIDGREIQATLSDISNPGAFVDGRQIGWDVRQKPDELTSNTEIMAYLEQIRRAGTSLMGLNPDVPSVPKIVLVYPPDSEDIDIRCQALSMQQAHKAVPGTLALNLGVASKIKGTIPYQLARQRDPQNTVIGHPSGKMEVGAEIEDGDIKGAKLIRTARWLMDGMVNDNLT